MSSMPPNIPPGGYDPRTQWRVYREQQRAAWRAQRDAWKAQQYAYKAKYHHAYGPRVPSVVGPLILVAIGIVWLLIYCRPHCSGELLDLVRQVVAADADCGGPGDAGRVGAGFAARSSGAARNRICGHPDSAGGDWILRIGNDARILGALGETIGATTTTTISSTCSACPSTIWISRF